MEWNALTVLRVPIYQALVLLLLTPVVIFISRPGSVDKAWVIAGLCFVLFLLINAVALWFNDSPWWYLLYSIASAVGYILIISFIMPGLLKFMRLDGSGESGMIFLVIIYQPFGLLLVILAKWIATNWF